MDLGLLLQLLLMLPAENFPPTGGFWDAEGVIQYVPGTAPIVLSAPHGGRRRPTGIPDRNSRGCLRSDGTCDWTRRCPHTTKCKALLYGDPNTDEIAWNTWRRLRESGLQPHIVVNHMDRSKMDPNRGGASLSEGVQNSRRAKACYDAYHSFLRTAVAKVRQKFNGTGILFDIHGQHHPQNWTEIGYRLTKRQLNSGQYPANQSSIRALIGRTNRSAGDLVIGGRSFGSVLASFGHRVVPSETIPAPGSGGYYRGGYITAAYGSVAAGQFDAVQVEVTQAIMYARSERRVEFAQHLAESVSVFVRENYFDWRQRFLPHD